MFLVLFYYLQPQPRERSYARFKQETLTGGKGNALNGHNAGSICDNRLRLFCQLGGSDCGDDCGRVPALEGITFRRSERLGLSITEKQKPGCECAAGLSVLQSPSSIDLDATSPYDSPKGDPPM